jgi:hypothetical protein
MSLSVYRYIYIYLYICKALSRTKQEGERERESLDLSECICYSRTETVVLTAVEKKRRKTPSVELANRKSPFFLFLIPSSAGYSLFSFGSTRLHLFFWCAIHLLNIPVSRTIPSSLFFSPI